MYILKRLCILYRKVMCILERLCMLYRKVMYILERLCVVQDLSFSYFAAVGGVIFV